MSADNFDRCLRWTLGYEGGYSYYRADPGKATMRGITQAVYDDDRRERNLPRRDVRGITDAELQAIYRRRYWQLAGCDALPSGLDFAVFDFAVNSGVSRAVKTLQALAGATQDGVYGSATLAAVRAVVGEFSAGVIADKLCSERQNFLASLPTFATFGKGWSARVLAVSSLSVRLSLGESLLDPVDPLPTPKTYACEALA